MPLTDTRPSPWRRAVPWILLGLGLVAAYAHNVREMWRRWFPAWRREDLGLIDRLMEGESYYTHAPLVPIVSFAVAMLLVRHTRFPVRKRPLLGGFVLGGSLLMHLVASLARVNFASGFTVLGVLASLVLMLWGVAALKRLWFPIAFLFFMVPLPEVSIARINFGLKMLAADTGVALANGLGIVAEQSGNQVFLEGDKQLVIANVCNGLRTLISLIAFGALYAYVCKLRGLWRLGLFVMSVPVAVVSNSVRIVALIVVADIWNTEVATGFFHDVSGLMIYAVAFGMMFGLERLVLAIRRWVGHPADVRPLFEDGRAPGEEGPWPAMVRAGASRAGWVAAILVILAAAGVHWLNRSVPSVWTGQVARSAVPQELEVDGARLRSYDMEMDDQTLTILETRDYLFRRYVRPGMPPTDFCIVFSEDNRKGTHPPDLCLEGGGQDIIAKADVALADVDGHAVLPCREILVQNGTDRHYYLYTYRCGNVYTESFWEQQVRIFLNGLLSRDSSGALIRVSTPVGRDVTEARRRAGRLLAAAVPHIDRAFP